MSEQRFLLVLMRENKLSGEVLLHCSTNPVNVEEELRWSAALLTPKSRSPITGSLPFPLKTRCIRFCATQLRVHNGKHIRTHREKWREVMFVNGE